MDGMSSITWFVFETMGIIAFSFSGAMVGIARRMDIFGITVLSVLTAVGGGMVRDVMAGIVPPSVLRAPSGLILSVATAIFVFVGYEFIRISGTRKKWITVLYHISDTIGLACFTVTGVLTARYTYPEYTVTLPVMLGLITAAGGGILRDIMAQRIPVVLKTDVYALASIIGAFITCFAWPVMGPALASWAGFAAVIILRVLAICYHWQLPHAHTRRRQI